MIDMMIGLIIASGHNAVYEVASITSALVMGRPFAISPLTASTLEAANKEIFDVIMNDTKEILGAIESFEAFGMNFGKDVKLDA